MKRILSSPHFLHQFATYVAVGGIAFLFDFLVLILCVKYIRTTLLVGTSVGFIVGAVLNYSLCVRFVFANRILEHSRGLEFTIFVTIGILGLLINDLVMVICSQYLSLQFQQGKVIAAVGVLLFNFLSRRTLLFKKPPSSAGLVTSNQLQQESV